MKDGRLSILLKIGEERFGSEKCDRKIGHIIFARSTKADFVVMEARRAWVSVKGRSPKTPLAISGWEAPTPL
jgi:hypothetical protein